MSYKIDLHIHSNRSDSSFEPKEIVDEAVKKGMIAVAIADHDTFTVSHDLQVYAKNHNIDLIACIEMSCMDETTGRKVHILGYGLSNNHPHIDALLIPFKKHLNEQRLKLLIPLKELGFDINKDDVFKNEILYKHDLALYMEKKGYGEYKKIFTKYFYGPTSLEQYYPITFNDVHKVIDAIHLDGGIAVLAHPRTYNTFNEIEKYIEWGIDGIEICHPSFKEGDYERIMKYPLLHFGGSDCHGKLNISKKREIGDYGISEEDYFKIRNLIYKDVGY